jgi:hypothetical protein
MDNRSSPNKRNEMNYEYDKTRTVSFIAYAHASMQLAVSATLETAQQG